MFHEARSLPRISRVSLDRHFSKRPDVLAEGISEGRRVYIVYHIDSFTRVKFSGNPAGVVVNATGLSDPEMQNIARELRHSETAFVLPSASNEFDVEVRFFTPTTEVPICGHATIAAHYALAKEMRLESCEIVQRTKAGILPVSLVRAEEDYKVIMTQGEVTFGNILGDIDKRTLMLALGLWSYDLDERLPIQIVSTGHSKVMIGIRSKEKLDSIDPDLNSLKELSKGIGCNGYYVFTFDSREGGMLTSGRMFAPAIGIDEDPVTGNANGPLGAYLVHYNLVSGITEFQFKAKQGEAIGRTGIVHVSVGIEGGEPVEVRIGGDAVVVFKTEIEL